MKTAYKRALKQQIESDSIPKTLRYEKIIQDCSIIKQTDKLKILYVLSDLSLHYKNRVLFFLGYFGFLLFSLSLISGFNFSSGFFLLLIIFSFSFLLYLLPITGKYLYYKKQKLELIIDNLTQIIKFHKYFAERKKSSTFKFDDIKSLIIKKDHRYPDDPIYKLSFILKKAKKFTIYKGKREACNRIGWNIARFIGKYCKYNT